MMHALRPALIAGVAVAAALGADTLVAPRVEQQWIRYGADVAAGVLVAALFGGLWKHK